MERAILRKIDQSIAEGNLEQRDLGRKFYRRFLKLTARGMTDISSAEGIAVFSPKETLPFEVPPLHYVSEQSRVIIGDESVDLTPLENRLLGYLQANPNRVISNGELLGNVWGGKRSVSVVEKGVSRLRNIIEPDPKRPVRIEAKRGHGYLYHSFEDPQLSDKSSEKI